MAKTHRESMLTTACIQTPVHPHTRTPITLYEREERRRGYRDPETPDNRRGAEREEEDDDLDSDMEKDEDSKTWQNRDWYIDITKVQNSDQAYYTQLERLKTAHLQSMEQLERMYEQKLNLKGVQSTEPDQAVARKKWRPLWEEGCLQPTLCEECFLKHDFNCSVSSQLLDSSADELTDGETCSGSEESVPARSKIAQMWNGFTIEDYIQNMLCPDHRKAQMQSNKKKAWSHKLTVPEPFQMTVRESKKKEMNIKSKSEIELENNILKKALEEEAECQKKFRANPVPASVYLPLYHEIVERNEERRKFVKEKSKEILLASQKPFQFIEREKHKKAVQKLHLSRLPNPEHKAKLFKAKPVPKSIYGESAKERLKEDELYRGIRIHMRAQELLNSSAYPTSTLAGSSRSGRKKSRCFKPKEEIEHKPKINSFVPNFEVLHQKNHKRLLKSKHSKHVTVCEPFCLRTDHISHTDKILKDIEADGEYLKETRWPYKSPRKPSPRDEWDDISPRGGPPSSTPKSTESSRRRQHAIRKSIEDKEKQEEDLKKRTARQKHLKKRIIARAKAFDPLQNMSLLSCSKLKELRKQDVQRTREYFEELGAMKERVNRTPLLLERATKKNARLAAEKHYSKVLRNLGLFEDFVIQKGKSFDLQNHVRASKEEQYTNDEDSSTEGTLELDDLQDNEESDKNGSEHSEQDEYSADSDHSDDVI
ncbi:protein FAM161A [Pelobates fuscus]|uniref:protein FAM161A n=1 Tax=Pelobates fuscus TaxID=191477 RepID=UPI002FE4D969